MSQSNNIKIIRKNVSNLSENELKSFRDAMDKIMKISDNRGYDHIAGFHGVPDWYCWHHGRNFRNITHVDLFLPWHRAYLKWIEDHLRDFDSSIAQCWWDWSSPLSHSEGIPRAYRDENVNGTQNPLYKFHIHEPGVNTNGLPQSDPINEDTFRDNNSLSQLPTVDDITNLYNNVDDFVDFSRQLEDIHDNIHGWVGGTMSDLGTAAFDPIFYAHHANIDRIWSIWQAQHGNSTIPSEWLNIALAPFPYTVQEVLNISSLGYDYATISAEVIL